MKKAPVGWTGALSVSSYQQEPVVMNLSIGQVCAWAGDANPKRPNDAMAADTNHTANLFRIQPPA